MSGSYIFCKLLLHLIKLRVSLFEIPPKVFWLVSLNFSLVGLQIYQTRIAKAIRSQLNCVTVCSHVHVLACLCVCVPIRIYVWSACLLMCLACSRVWWAGVLTYLCISMLSILYVLAVLKYLFCLHACMHLFALHLKS